MKLSFKQKVLVNVMIIVACFVLFATALYILEGDLEVTAKDIRKQRMALGDQLAAVESLSLLKKESVEAAQLSGQINLLLPDKDQMLFVRDWLIGGGKSYNVSVSVSLGTNNVPVSDAPGYLNFLVSSRGAYENVVAYLKSLEFGAQRFLVVLDSFDLREFNKNDYQITCAGRVFYR